MMVNKVAIIDNYAPHYRLPLWSALARTRNIEYWFFAFSREANGIKTISQRELLENNIKYKELKNIRFKEIVIWQKGIMKIVLKKDFSHYVFNGDMYCLSTWLAALVLRRSGIKITFWGHGLYGNEWWLKKRIRMLFNKLPTYHLLYGDRAKKLLIRENLNAQNLYVVYNSLDYKLQKRVFYSLKQESLTKTKFEIFQNYENTIIFIGRLTKEKRLDLLIDALNILKAKGIRYNLLLIGEGPETKAIIRKINKYGLDKIKFWGPCYSENIIGELIGLADITVSPGNVGLTAIHSLSFGTPVITHNDFTDQGPEVEIIEDEITGAFFVKEDSMCLANSIQNWFSKNPDSNLKRQRCRMKIDKYYNPDYQISVFNDLILGKVPTD